MVYLDQHSTAGGKIALKIFERRKAGRQAEVVSGVLILKT
jgi:hypothetical protein